MFYINLQLINYTNNKYKSYLFIWVSFTFMFLSQVRKTNLPAGIDKAKERRSSYWLGSTSGTCRRSRTAAPPSTTRPLHHCLGSPRSGRETSPRTPGPLTRRSAESPPPPPPPPAPPRWTFLLLHRRADWSNCSDGCYSPSLPACRFSALGNNLSLWTLSLKGLLADHTNKLSEERLPGSTQTQGALKAII